MDLCNYISSEKTTEIDMSKLGLPFNVKGSTLRRTKVRDNSHFPSVYIYDTLRFATKLEVSKSTKGGRQSNFIHEQTNGLILQLNQTKGLTGTPANETITLKCAA